MENFDYLLPRNLFISIFFYYLYCYCYYCYYGSYATLAYSCAQLYSVTKNNQNKKKTGKKTIIKLKK